MRNLEKTSETIIVFKKRSCQLVIYSEIYCYTLAMKSNLDFLAIGDITTDAFIRLQDASVHCNVDNEKCELCMKFADKVPYEFVEVVRAVGNSANAAVSAARLGLNSSLMADIGGDENGKECLAELKKNKVLTKSVTVHKKMKTNYHYVLWFEQDRTILVKHEHFDYKFVEPKRAPAWVYLSSLGEDTFSYHMHIAQYIKKHPEIKFVFQPGTFQMKMGRAKLSELYKMSHVFFCNVEEAKRILEIKDDTITSESKIKELLQKMHEVGPKIVVITDGPKGAYVFDGANGNTMWFMPPYPDVKPPYERTGAGDAFASTFTAALALGKSVEEALMWAPINSMSVVQEIGAQRGLLSREKLEEYLEKAPADFKPRRI